MTYKIIDSEGNVLAKGYKQKQTAINDLRHYQLNKKDKLEVVEE